MTENIGKVVKRQDGTYGVISDVVKVKGAGKRGQLAFEVTFCVVGDLANTYTWEKNDGDLARQSHENVASGLVRSGEGCGAAAGLSRGEDSEESEPLTGVGVLGVAVAVPGARMKNQQSYRKLTREQSVLMVPFNLHQLHKLTRFVMEPHCDTRYRSNGNKRNFERFIPSNDIL